MPTQLQQDLEDLRASSNNITNVLEREIIKSKYVINALANVLDEGLIILNRDHKIAVMNNSAATMMGLDPDNIIGQHINTIYTQSYNDDLMSIHREWTIIDPSTGLPRYLDVMVSRIGTSLPEDPEAPAYILTARDVTFKRSSEFKVLDLSSFQNNLIASLPVPTFYTDKTGGYIRGSQSFFEFMGFNRVKALSKNIDDFVPKTTARRFKDSRVHTDVMKCVVTTPTGDRNVILYKGTLKSVDGAIIGLIGSMVDTDNCMIDEVSEMVLRAIEVCPDPIALMSFPQGKLFLVNKAFTNKFGYSKLEASTMGMTDMLSPFVNVETLKRTVIPKIKGGEPSRLEVSLSSKVGVVNVCRLLVLPLSKVDNKHVHYCMIVGEA